MPSSVSHRERGDLEWRVWIFSVAAVVGLAGLYFDETWITGTAIGLLAMAMLLRFLPGRDPSGAPEDEDVEDEGVDQAQEPRG